MADDRLEILDADPNVELLFHRNVFKVQVIYAYGGLERLSKDFCSSLLRCRESYRSLQTIPIHNLLSVTGESKPAVFIVHIQLFRLRSKVFTE